MELNNRWDEWAWEVERDKEKPDEGSVWESHFAGNKGRRKAFPLWHFVTGTADLGPALSL